MDIKVSDFAHDSSLGIFTAVVADKKLSSKNPFSLFSSVLGFYDPKNRPLVAQRLTPVVEQWNMCLSPSLSDAADHSITKQASDDFYNTLSLICPAEVEKYKTKYISDQNRQYTRMEVVTLLNKLECKDEVLLGKVGMHNDVNLETGALNDNGIKKIRNMTKEQRKDVEDAFTSTTIRNPCGTSNSCASILDEVIQVQSNSVLNALQQAKQSEKMQTITTAIIVVGIILILIAFCIVFGIYRSRHNKRTVVQGSAKGADGADGADGEMGESVATNILPPAELSFDTDFDLSPIML